MKISLGSSSARADIQRGTVMTERECWDHVHKLWDDWKGVRNFLTGQIGHHSMDGKTFYVWRELRTEWVADYLQAIENERTDAKAWACRQ